MIYIMTYQMSDSTFAHFTCLVAGVYMKIPINELNNAMREEITKEDPRLQVEVTVLKFPIP
jgi:hypothetical protein